MKTDNEYQKMNLNEITAERDKAEVEVQNILDELSIANKHLRWMGVFVNDKLHDSHKCGGCVHFRVGSCNHELLGHITRKDYDLACKLYEE